MTKQKARRVPAPVPVPAPGETLIQLLRRLPRPLVARQTAPMLGMSRISLYRLVKKNAIPTLRVGPYALRFDPRALATWLEAK